MTAVTPHCFWCWCFPHLGRAFPGRPRAAGSAILRWLCHGLLRRCWSSRKSHGQSARVSSRSERIQDLPQPIENPSRHPPERCSRWWVPQPRAVPCYLVVCPQTQSSTRQLSGPKEQLTHICPKRSCPAHCPLSGTSAPLGWRTLTSKQTTALWKLVREALTKTWPLQRAFPKASRAVALCFSDRSLVLTLPHEKGQEPRALGLGPTWCVCGHKMG